MREQFENLRFTVAKQFQIQQANIILDEYMADSLVMTVRQLYYQFVARDWIENTQPNYKKLSSNISRGRLAGLIDWDAIEDRTRFLRGVNTHESPLDMITQGLKSYAIDMWEGQEYRVEVWIEKDALVGVIEQVCRNNDVDYFACRGYASQSALYKAGKRAAWYEHHEGKQTVILHMGDHDSSGIDMTRDNNDRVELFANMGVEVRRIALNHDQIDEYNPPPNPAKMTDPRAKGYVKRYGYQSWELDALEPRVMQKLVTDEILSLRDTDLWNGRVDQLVDDKEALREIIFKLEE